MSTGAAIAGMIGKTAGSVLGAGYGNSYSEGYSQGGSSGSSWNSGGSQNSSWSNDISENWSNNWGNSWSEAFSRVYGREASAQDILRAEEANQLQQDLWLAQAIYNSAEAEKARQYQTEMSNTAYQRAVADLKSAGLNPILAIQNMGASTPVGAMASSGLATAHKAQTFPEQYSKSSSGSSWGGSSYGYSKGSSGSSGSSWENGGGSSKSWNYGQERSRSETSNNIRGLTQYAIGALENLFKSPNNSKKGNPKQ